MTAHLLLWVNILNQQLYIGSNKTDSIFYMLLSVSCIFTSQHCQMWLHNISHAKTLFPIAMTLSKF